MRTIRGAGGKNKGGSSPRLPVEASDTLRSTSFARVLDLIAEGEIEGLVDGLRSIYLDGTPIQNPDGSMNFTGVTMATVNGTQNQEFIPGFGGTEQEFDVSAEVKLDLPITRTITNPEADAARITLTVPALTKQDVLTGDVTGTAVLIGIAVQSNGGGFLFKYLSRQWINCPNPANSPGTGLNITVLWSAIGDFTLRVVKFDVQYREIGAMSWTTLKQDSFTSAQMFSNRGVRYSGSPFTVSRSYEVTGLPDLYYEARVVVTSGTGTLTVSVLSVLIEVPFDWIRGKASSPYQRSYRVPLTGSPPWDIRVYRLTNDSTTATLQNKTFFSSYAELTDEKFSYPNTALVGIVIDAEQFSAIPTRGYDMKLLRCHIPSNYDPVTREYDGIWDGTFVIAWTDNPAWCFYELLINARFGLGNYLSTSQIDKWALYTISQYCDGLVPNGEGGLEPRFTCNAYLQTQEEAYTVLATMASIFRGMAYWEAGAITVAQDSPSDPVFLFTEANVEEGLFTYSGSSKNARHTVALVSWSDPEDGFKLRPEYVEDADGIARYGVSSIAVTAFACISRGEARRVGEWILYSERFETEVVIFRCGHDGVYVRPGNIFAVQDQHRAGLRFGGRLRSATVSAVVVDAAITIESGKTYTLQVVLPDGSLETKTISNAPGSATTLTITPDFDVAPSPLAVWIVTSSSLSPRLYRCISIVEPDRQTYEITGIAHEPSKFDYIERDIPLTPLNYSSLLIAPATPQNLVVSEAITIRQGIAVVIVTIRWDPVATASRYLVEYRRDNGNYVTMPEVRQRSIEIIDAQPGLYEIRVTAKNVLGISSAHPGSETRYILGKMAPPADVTGFLVTQMVDRLLFTWNAVADLDVDYYEIRRGLTWNSALYITTSRERFAEVILYANGQFFIKAVDTSGNPSINAASVLIQNPFTETHAGGLSDSASWSGTHDDTSGTPEGLILTDNENWTTLSAAWSTYVDPWVVYSDPLFSGTYVTGIFDFGAVGLFNPVFETFVFEQLLAKGATWVVQERTWLEYTHPWTGVPSNVSIAIELGTNQTGSVFIAAYSFAPYAEGFVKARAFRFRFTLTTTDANYLPRLTSFAANFYFRQRVVPFNDAAVTAQPWSDLSSSWSTYTTYWESFAATTLTISPRFALVPAVTASVQGGVLGDTFIIADKGESYVRVIIVDSDMNAKSGLIDVTAVGVGDVF